MVRESQSLPDYSPATIRRGAYVSTLILIVLSLVGIWLVAVSSTNLAHIVTASVGHVAQRSAATRMASPSVP